MENWQDTYSLGKSSAEIKTNKLKYSLLNDAHSEDTISRLLDKYSLLMPKDRLKSLVEDIWDKIDGLWNEKTTIVSTCQDDINCLKNIILWHEKEVITTVLEDFWDDVEVNHDEVFDAYEYAKMRKMKSAKNLKTYGKEVTGIEGTWIENMDERFESSISLNYLIDDLWLKVILPLFDNKEIVEIINKKLDNESILNKEILLNPHNAKIIMELLWKIIFWNKFPHDLNWNWQKYFFKRQFSWMNEAQIIADLNIRWIMKWNEIDADIFKNLIKN